MIVRSVFFTEWPWSSLCFWLFSSPPIAAARCREQFVRVPNVILQLVIGRSLLQDILPKWFSTRTSYTYTTNNDTEWGRDFLMLPSKKQKKWHRVRLLWNSVCPLNKWFQACTLGWMYSCSSLRHCQVLKDFPACGHIFLINVFNPKILS